MHTPLSPANDVPAFRSIDNVMLSSRTSMSTTTAIANFFTSSQYAVVGASPSPQKFGHKVLAWYRAHNLPVTPINPRVDTILSLKTLPSISELPDPANTGVSIITPPPVTEQILDEAVKIGVKKVFLQPGAWEGEEMLEKARERGLLVVAGGQDEVGYEGACVLVHGEEGMQTARSLEKSGRL